MLMIAKILIKKERLDCGEDYYYYNIQNVFLALLYPLTVPAISIYYSGKLLLGGEDEYDRLTRMTAWKIGELIGQDFLFIILQIKF